MRHIARSLDRLLTYAEGNQLSAAQLEALATELAPQAIAAEVLKEFRDGIESATRRIQNIPHDSFEEPREARAGNVSPPPSAACSSTAPNTPSAT